MVAEFRAWGARKHSPPSERGAPPGERWAIGLCLQSEWKGRRGEYCGVPSMIAFAWSIRNGVDGLVAVAEPRLPRRPCAVLPPSRPLPHPFFHAWTSHSWPRHPPLGGGRVLSPFLLLAPCIRGIPWVLPQNSPESRKNARGAGGSARVAALEGRVT